MPPHGARENGGPRPLSPQVEVPSPSNRVAAAVVVVLVLVAGGLLLAATVVFTFPCSVPQNAAALLRNRAVAACGAMSSDQRFFAGVFGYGGFAAALAAVASGIRFALTGRREDLLYGFIVVMMLLAGIQLAGLYAYA